MALEHSSVETNGIYLHVVSAGPKDGIPIILLHGFPEFWFSYRFLIPVLTQAGFRVIVPDQRGYNLSDKQGPYDILTLCQDISGLQDSLGIERSHLVGHDWGGAVAWVFSALNPQRVNRLGILNAPHLNALLDTFRRHPTQLLKSLYIFYFQLPWFPEATIRFRKFRILARAFAEIHPEYMPAEAIEAYKRAWRQPGALTAMLGWYRAAVFSPVSKSLFRSPLLVTCPTRVIWGENDPYLDRACNETLPRYVQNLEVRYIKNASHWVPMDQPELVNSLLLQFFTDHT